MGYIYVMTNESYADNIIKIGYTKDIERRQKELFTTAVPVPFDIYCTYETPMENSDRIIHEKFSKFRVNGKREFFHLAPEKVYEELTQIARISGTTDKLRLYDNNKETDKIESAQQVPETSPHNTCSDDEPIYNASFPRHSPRITAMLRLYDSTKETDKIESAQQVPETSPHNTCSDDEPIYNIAFPRRYGLLQRPPIFRGPDFNIYHSDHDIYEPTPKVHPIILNGKCHIIITGADTESHDIATAIFAKAYALFAQSGYTDRKVHLEMAYDKEETSIHNISAELYSWGQSNRTYDEIPTEVPQGDIRYYIEIVTIGTNVNIIDITFRESAVKMLQDNNTLIKGLIIKELKGETYEASATI